MGLLTDAAQVLRGTKTFANDVIIKGKLRLEGEITRTARAAFKLDMSGATDWGTKKGVTNVVIYNTAPGGAATVTVSAQAYVPAGTKAITIYVSWVTANVSRVVRVQKTGSGVNEWAVRTQAANVQNDGNGDVELDANGAFDLDFSNAATSLSVQLTGVYL